MSSDRALGQWGKGYIMYGKEIALEAKLERPPWLMQRIPAGGDFTRVNELIQGLHLNTVCQSAHCPNIGECFGSGTATFLILGGSCTRRCTFCAVPKGEPQPVDPAEPSRIVEAALVMKFRHAVLTSVTRDDLSDGGAGHFAECIREFRRQAPETTVEVLTPDFCGSIPALATVLVERPDVFNHNIETVPRLYPFVRPLADYGRSLKVLSAAASAGIGVVKSGLMVGLGERSGEMLRYSGIL